MSVTLFDQSSIKDDEPKCSCVVKDVLKTNGDRFILTLPSSSTFANLYSEVSKKVQYVSGTFNLVLICTKKVKDEYDAHSEVEVGEEDQHHLDSTLSTTSKNFLEIREKPGVAVEMVYPSTILEDMGPATSSSCGGYRVDSESHMHRRMAVSSPDTDKLNEHIRQKADEMASNRLSNASKCPTENDEPKDVRFVGLVNQAMTCYLNSLIQTLYMTPDFKTALARWECHNQDDTTSSIPYQLQHLFLLLQTSNKESVETTGLTRSFGWDSSEAWQQHDIQELCRVMFDALENTFQGTDQADLIKRLYEGTMKDYVQCCECHHESARNDTFLDVPITIRPFGATTSYKSVIEGLNAFVEPETLDESNQYYCEKCDKKCDAKKGLKFTKFPYLLTLQLKRFDFDYSTMHRIKLNDCMQFPQILNLNSFTEDTSKDTTSSSTDDDPVNNEEMDDLCEENKEQVDEEDTSSHDSGHDPDRNLPGGSTGDGMNEQSSEEEASSVDEGIDFESQLSHRRKRRNSWWLNDEEALVDSYLQEGPYVYELFSIMIHSGSAAGGHYYAYIKSFENNRWHSFNDQIVSSITNLDIEKTFGGVSYPRTSSSYYSTFSSSTNAYMLMYRQINKQRNSMFTETTELPSHIQDLVHREEEEERLRIMKIEQERNMCSIRLFLRHPSLVGHLVQPILDKTFEFHKDTTLVDAVKQAHMLMRIKSEVVPVDRCRLVKYDHINDVLDRSYDIDSEDVEKTLSQLLGGPRNSYLFDLLLETREEDEKFEKYESGGVTLKTFLADPEALNLHDQVTIRVTEQQTVLDMKTRIAEKLNLSLASMLVVHERYRGECHILTNDAKTLKSEGFFRSAKLYVDLMTEEESSSDSLKLEDTRLWNILDKIANLLTINIVLPSEVTEYFNNMQQAMEKTNLDSKLNGQASSSSSDEGVGSLGDSSGNSSSPPQHPPEAVESMNDDETMDSNCGEIESFWQIPELSHEDQTNEGERRRNNSYDNDSILSSVLNDLPGKLQKRFEETGYMIPASPTSSLKCNSSQSDPPSLMTDMEFDEMANESFDASNYNDDVEQVLSVESEGSSLSTSCSTLGSTDTICHPVEGSCHATEMSPAEVVRKSVDVNQSEVVAPCHCPKPLATGLPKYSTGKCYPGHVVQCAAVEPTLDYTKALMYADSNSNTSVDPLITDNRTDPDGTGDAHVCANKPKQLPIVTNEPVKSVMWNDNVSVAPDATAEPCDSCHDKSTAPSSSNVNFCSPQISCATCGSSPSQYMKESTSQDLPNLSSTAGSSATAPKDIPESSEACEKINPLFSCSPYYKKSILSSSEGILDSVSRSRRERTISCSSAASDGWGVSSEIAQKQFYFRVLEVQQNENEENKPCKELHVEMDKRMPLLSLKRHLAHFVGTATRRFVIYRKYASGQENEMSQLTEDFRTIPNSTLFVVKLGRALRKDEYRCKLYQLKLYEEETAKPLMNWVIQRGVTVGDARNLLCEDITEQCDIHTQPERIRIRKKMWKTPSQVYLENDKFGTNISLYGTIEFFIEFLDKPEPKTAANQLVLLCRRWRPSMLKFEDFEEVVLKDEVVSSTYLGWNADHLRKQLAVVSGIPIDDIQMAKGRGMFPFRTSVLDADTSLDWVPTSTSPHTFSMHLTEDGTVVFYRDKSEEIKEITEEERKVIMDEEMKSNSTISASTKTNKDLSGASTKPVSYRREKALKIFIPPSRNKEVTTEL
ncbi:ubiquitin carboxyl-terminal hydrolase 47 [Ciona intestinalis]